MPARLAEIHQLVGGRLIGSGDVEITGAAPLRGVQSGQITFIDQADKARLLAKCSAAAAIVPAGAVVEMPCIEVDQVDTAFAAIVTYFRPRRAVTRRGISPQAIVSPSAVIGSDVDIHAGATVGDDVTIGGGSTIHCGAHILAGCRLGENVTVYPCAVLYEDTIVGPRCVIHSGAVLGADGFGYKVVEGRHRPTAQLGYVEIGPDVDIGANSTIDRGTYGPTVIGEGTKIDNLVMIAHNCRIGRHNVLCSQVGIAGSSSTGDYVVMAGQVGVRDHVHIGDRAMLGAMAGIIKDVPEGAMMVGAPAGPAREQKLRHALFARLPDMRRQLGALEDELAALKRQVGGESNAA